jgi:hypothetical protein
VFRYYVEFAADLSNQKQGLSVGHYLYVYAYSEQHVRDMFEEKENGYKSVLFFRG